jgi:outer membrane protein assembly factor BamD (BamD/ComL family)
MRLILVLLLALIGGCADPEKAWELAEREDTNQGYLEFLAKFPDGEYADRARSRMQALQEIRAWERAQFRDRIDNYARFLSEYPDSEFAPAARTRIAELERDAEWRGVRAADSISVLESFLERYPDAPQAEEARQLIAALTPPEPEEPPEPEPPPERAGNFRVQVGTFRTAAAAEAELRRLVSLFPETLIGPVRLQTPEETGGRLFLLKTVPMTYEEATAACAGLKAGGQDCFIVNR